MHKNLRLANLKVKNSENRGVAGKIILKWIFKK